MDAERRRRHQPAVEARLGDDVFAVENICKAADIGQRLIGCSHAFPLGCAFQRVFGYASVS